MHDFYSALLLLAAGVSYWHVFGIWKRPIPLTRSTVVFLLGMGWWSTAYALHWSDAPRPYPLFWLEMTYLGVVVVPTTFFLYALRHTGHDRWLNRRWLVLFAIEPLLTVLILWTDPLHGFFYGGATPGGGAMLQGGVWFWINVFYSYALMFVATVLFFRHYRRATALYRGQTRLILIGALLPWFVNALMLTGIEPLPGLDLTPIAFTLTGLAFAYGVRHYQLLDILPVARDALIEHMADGVIVIDNQNRLLDINPSGMHMLGLTSEAPIGQPLEPLLGRWPNLVERFRTIPEGRFQVEIVGVPPQFVDLLIVPLHERKGHVPGRLLVLRDISALKRTEQELRQRNRQLNAQIAEIERLQDELRHQAIRDPLTGLYNRRYLTEVLDKSIRRALGMKEPLCVLLMDVDNFKFFNDRYGHSTGDRLLEHFGKTVLRISGLRERAFRYGGDEFVIVLPGARLEDGRRTADELRLALARNPFIHENSVLPVKLSTGMAVFPIHGDNSALLLHRADRALYAAKERGRDRLEVATDP